MVFPANPFALGCQSRNIYPFASLTFRNTCHSIRSAQYQRVRKARLNNVRTSPSRLGKISTHQAILDSATANSAAQNPGDSTAPIRIGLPCARRLAPAQILVVWPEQIERDEATWMTAA